MSKNDEKQLQLHCLIKSTRLVADIGITFISLATHMIMLNGKAQLCLLHVLLTIFYELNITYRQELCKLFNQIPCNLANATICYTITC